MTKCQFDRRDFLKVMGLSGVTAALAGCDLPATISLEEGKETVVSYLTPTEYMIPGVGVWYASTCLQCSAGCGVHGRVREGRALKFEGNPGSGISGGKLCQMGQAALQNHYHPDRVTTPLMRDGEGFKEVSWDDALATISDKAGSVGPNRFAWVTGTVSGHQRALIEAHLGAMNSRRHYTQEMVNSSVWQAVCQATLGDSMPRLRMDKAKLILSFGADFLGASDSPVLNSREYGQFRAAPRGMLIQAEPKMTLTGGNADQWVALRPGTEGALALGIANVLLREAPSLGNALSGQARAMVQGFEMEKAARITGVAGDRIVRIATLLRERTPSLVIAGASAGAHAHGFDATAAVMLLNIMLGNVGQTIEPSADIAMADLAPKTGGSADLVKFADDAGNLDLVFIHGANPVYDAPATLGLTEKMGSIGFKVAFSQFMDETTAMADLVLPMHSPIEDWGTHVAAQRPAQAQIGLQQPLMEPIHPGTRGFGDVLLALLKDRDSGGVFDAFEDYYGYLRNFAANVPAELKGGADDETFWNSTLMSGAVNVPSARRSLSVTDSAVNIPEYEVDSAYPYHLVPSPRLGIWDGRHANLPVMLEAPDQISKIVWDTWAEVHPSTAEKLGVGDGDYVEIASKNGSIKVPVFIHKGIHADAVAVPMGLGHESYGRWATGVGANPNTLLDNTTDATTGELAMQATRVKLAPTGANKSFARIGNEESQHGRKLVATVTATRFQRTEGEA